MVRTDNFLEVVITDSNFFEDVITDSTSLVLKVK